MLSTIKALPHSYQLRYCTCLGSVWACKTSQQLVFASTGHNTCGQVNGEL